MYYQHLNTDLSGDWVRIMRANDNVAPLSPMMTGNFSAMSRPLNPVTAHRLG
jgi:hypothetical protein